MVRSLVPWTLAATGALCASSAACGGCDSSSDVGSNVGDAETDSGCYALPTAPLSSNTEPPPRQFATWGTVGPSFAAISGSTEVPAAYNPWPPSAPSAAEQDSGVILFARDPFDVVPSAIGPGPGERASTIRALVARGEYEPLSLLVSATTDLQNVSVHVSELKTADGVTFPADHVDVRVVRSVPTSVSSNQYAWIPFLLEKRSSFALAKGQTGQVWLTVRAPADAEAGDYQGTLTVQADGRSPSSVNVLLRVLPFSLPPPPFQATMSYPTVASSDAGLTRDMVDMAEHGIGNYIDDLDVLLASYDQVFGADDIQLTQTAGLRIMSAAKQVWGSWPQPTYFGLGNQIAYYWDNSIGWFVFWPHSSKIDSDFLTAIGVIQAMATQNGWMNLSAFALDESGAHGQLDEAKYYYGLIKQNKPELTTWATIGGGIALGSDEIGELSSVVDYFITNRFSPEIAASLIARGKPYGVYNGARSTPPSSRTFFGFYGYKTGANQVSQWAYNTGEGVFDQSGLRQTGEGFIYHASDGPLPSLLWEAIREGVDDARYVERLRELIAAARSSPEPSVQRAATTAQATLDGVTMQVDWGFQGVDSNSPEPHPSTLRKWRVQIAAQILMLMRGLGDAGAGTLAAAPAVSPLSLGWASIPQPSFTHGPELAAQTGFEGSLAPWQVQAWNGKGSGTLDGTMAHGGSDSVRIDIPSTESANAVTVLVWNPSITLQALHTYELSAWVKLQNRVSPPTLRISLTSGTTSSTTGSDPPDTSGWQRLWVRVEPTVAQVPAYLAVWLQGPGTVWVDDVSFKEAIAPPIAVATDQAAYDNADVLGVATLGLAPAATAAQVRFTLAPASGSPLAQMTVPFSYSGTTQATSSGSTASLTLSAPNGLAGAHVAFQPALLAPGSFRVSAELLDAGDATLSSATTSFERTLNFDEWAQQPFGPCPP